MLTKLPVGSWTGPIWECASKPAKNVHLLMRRKVQWRCAGCWLICPRIGMTIQNVGFLQIVPQILGMIWVNLGLVATNMPRKTDLLELRHFKEYIIYPQVLVSCLGLVEPPRPASISLICSLSPYLCSMIQNRSYPYIHMYRTNIEPIRVSEIQSIHSCIHPLWFILIFNGSFDTPIPYCWSNPSPSIHMYMDMHMQRMHIYTYMSLCNYVYMCVCTYMYMCICIPICT